MPRLLLDLRLLSLWVLLCLVSANSGRNDRKKSYSYQFVNRQYSHLGDFDYFDLYNNDEAPETRWLCFFLGMCSVNWPFTSGAQANGIAPVYEWTQLEFDYATERERQADIDSGVFQVENPAPIDVDVYYSSSNKNKVFVTIPRFQDGIPVTLGTVTEKTYKGNPVIAPFPSWRWHRNSKLCSTDRLVSVFRVKIDECGRLWVLDNGGIGDSRICPAQILAFDVQTGDVLHRYEIPKSQLHSTSILVTPIVDVRDPHMKCRDTFVYAADCQGMGLIVYDVKRGKSWRVVDKTMYPYPSYGTYRIVGEEFDLMDGILGMDLSPYQPGADRVLFFHAMSSPTENWVHTSYLRNYTIFEHDPSAAPHIFHTYSGQRNTQCPAQAIDKNGISYFGLASDTSINCWNTATEYGGRNIGVLAQNQTTLQFPSGMKVINNRQNKQELWFVTNRFQKLATGTLTNTEVNFRIQAAKIDELTKGSKCLNRPNGQAAHQEMGGNHRPSYAGGYNGNKHKIKYRVDTVMFPES